MGDTTTNGPDEGAGGIQVSVQALIERYQAEVGNLTSRALQAEAGMAAVQARLAETEQALAQARAESRNDG